MNRILLYVSIVVVLGVGTIYMGKANKITEILAVVPSVPSFHPSTSTTSKDKASPNKADASPTVIIQKPETTPSYTPPYVPPQIVYVPVIQPVYIAPAPQVAPEPMPEPPTPPSNPVVAVAAELTPSIELETISQTSTSIGLDSPEVLVATLRVKVNNVGDGVFLNNSSLNLASLPIHSRVVICEHGQECLPVTTDGGNSNIYERFSSTDYEERTIKVYVDTLGVVNDGTIPSLSSKLNIQKTLEFIISGRQESGVSLHSNTIAIPFTLVE